MRGAREYQGNDGHNAHIAQRAAMDSDDFVDLVHGCELREMLN
jgi:hypothetical protein